MAANSQQFSQRDAPVRKVQEVSDASINDKLSELTSFVKKLATGGDQIQQVNPCRICNITDHTTDTCKIFLDEIEAHANAIGTGKFQGRKYDPHSNTYNPGWRDHPNLRYGNQQGPQPPQKGQYNTKPQGENYGQ
ncbi:hypothetical protein ACS0TY_017914 [Phlomoides rotata]